MPERFGLGCHCGFTTDNPQELLDHILVTNHIALDPGVESGDTAELLEMFATVQRLAADAEAGKPLPDGIEIHPVSVADILTDDDLSDDEKQELLTRLADLEAREGKK